MRYITTRSADRTYSLREAAMAGLAPDGGLFMPCEIPQVDLAEVNERAASSFAEMAEYLAALFFEGDLTRAEIARATREAFDFAVPLRRVGEGLHTLELFHGPTAAFKDFGAGFMGRTLGLLREGRERLTILTATSGDTGSAVAHGFRGAEGIDVVVLYPEGKVSDLQESQMTTLGGNVHALRVSGTFDDCQRMVKEVFADRPFRARHNVTSANSINLLRWIPQSFYYFRGRELWLAAGGEDAPDVVVPSGNYGNLAAGMLAGRMGLPLGRLVAASNANDVVPEWLRTGVYRPRPSLRTVANAMDVGAPSNYERMVAMTGRFTGGAGNSQGAGDGIAANVAPSGGHITGGVSDGAGAADCAMSGAVEALRREIAGWASSDDDIRCAIHELHDRYGYISDPHGAAGYNAIKGLNVNGFWLSTASPAKFGEVIEPVLGLSPEVPERLARLTSLPKISTPIAPDTEALKEFVASLLR